MPTASATAKLPSSWDHVELPSPSDRREPPLPLDLAARPSLLIQDPLRDAPLRLVEPVSVAWAAQEAELDAETADLEAAGALVAPIEEEWPCLALDPVSTPLEESHDWLADLSGPSLDADTAATADANGLKAPWRGLRNYRSSGGRAGFAAGGTADLSAPGAALAGFAEDAHGAGLSNLTDDELAGVIRAGRRLSSWASALELAAVGDLMRRREAQEAAGDPYAAEHVDAEIAALLTLTGRGAGRVLDMAIGLQRLPLTARALAAGVIDLPRVAVIVDETTALDDDQAGAVEQHILVRAPGQTTSQVRAAARRAVIATDPNAARKRQEQAQREARVERWDEPAGTAALAGRDLPPAAVIAADQHISALARELRAAGLVGTSDQLRAHAFLALLSGAPAGTLLPTDQHQPYSPAASGPGTVPSRSATASASGRTTNASRGSTNAPRATVSAPGGTASGAGATTNTPQGSTNAPRAAVSGAGGTASGAGTTTSGRGATTATPSTASAPGANARRPEATFPSPSATLDQPGLPAVAGIVNLTMPLGTWLGFLDTPSEVSGFGPLAADDSRQLATAMGKHSQTRWCVTLTGADGRPVAHGCARPGSGAPGPSPSSWPTAQQGPAPPARSHGLGERTPAPPDQRSTSARQTSTPPGRGPSPPDQTSTPSASLAGDPAPFSEGKARVAAWLARISMTWFGTAGCTHQRQSTAYRPPATLQHLIRIRQQTCAFPGCRRPASQCDLDHTTPFQQGGLTCECNLAPLCRAHHRAKQAPGWHLTQDQPGVMTWQLPSGRAYQTAGDPYPA